jgi:hypothetical protein
MTRQAATLETSVENIREDVMNAGFRPGRKVRIHVEYLDAADARKMERQRLSTLLDQYPEDPAFAGLSKEALLNLADSEIGAYRKERGGARK